MMPAVRICPFLSRFSGSQRQLFIRTHNRLGLKLVSFLFCVDNERRKEFELLGLFPNAHISENGCGTLETADPSVPSKEDIPTFDEWKKKVMEVEKEKSQSLTSTNGSPHPVKKVQKNFKNNYASVECGAKILSANSEAKSTSAILMENMDIYMLNPCSTKIWFVIELCEPIQVKQLDIANFELFSSTPKDFLVSISDRYPTNKWIKLGTFHARDERTVQSFPLDEQLYAKYVKVELQSHFGSEHFCPLSLFRVFGTSMVEEIDELADPYPPGRVDDPDEEYDFLPGYLPSEDQSSKNLLGSATSTVLNIINVVSSMSLNAPRLDFTDLDQDLTVEDQSGSFAEAPGESVDPGGDPVVRLVEEEEEDAAPESTVTLLPREEDDDEQQSEEQRWAEASQRESLFYCAHLSALSCLATLQEQLYGWCSVALAIHRQRWDRQRARHTPTHTSSSHLDLQPTPTPTQEPPPPSENLPEAEQTASPPQMERASGTETTSAPHHPSNGQGDGGVEHIPDPIVLEPSHTSTLLPHSFTDASLSRPTPTEDMPEPPTGELPDLHQLPAYLERVPETQMEGRRTSSTPQPTPSTTLSILTSTIEALIPETEPPRVELPVLSTEQPVQPLPTNTRPADIPPPTELPVPPVEVTDSSHSGVEEPNRATSTQHDQPDAPILQGEPRAEDTVEDILLSVPSTNGGLQRSATDFYAELQNSAEFNHGNGNQVHGSNQKESVFMRLNNRIKALEMNMSLSSRYLEELSQRYRKQMEEMQRAFNKTIIKLQNTSRIAEEQDQKQTESIQALQTQLENVTRIMLNLSATVVQLKREVSDRQSYLVVSLFLCVLLALLLCVQCCRSSSNHSSTTSPVVPMSNHYPSPKRCFSSYDDMSLQRKVPCPLVRSKSFQLPSSDVGPDDLFIVEPLRFSPEKKKKRCKMRAVETLKPSVPVTTTVSNDTPKCNGVYEIMGFLQSPDGDLSTSSSKDTATSEVSSEGSSTLSDESHCHSLCNGQVPRPSGRSRAEKRSFKRRQSKMAEQLIHYEDQLLHAPVSMTTGTVEGRQELGVGVGTFRVPTVTGHV
uniref:SUN domain-containing protein n=1 Tax=Denticeps clupeoides TaxID=299321 RepID=A0AAY4D1Z4_9TELE